MTGVVWIKLRDAVWREVKAEILIKAFEQTTQTPKMEIPAKRDAMMCFDCEAG
jgi:hypothetical protein